MVLNLGDEPPGSRDKDSNCRLGSHERATACVARRRPSQQLETISTAHGKILRLYRKHRPDVGQVKHAQQTDLPVADLTSIFGRDDDGSCPWRKQESPRRLRPADNVKGL